MNQVAVREPGARSVLIDMSDRYGMEPAAFEATLRATVVPRECTREQFAAFLLVAKEYKLNPLLKEIYAFPSKGGIQPIVGVDGWANLINSHPAFDGMDFEDHFNQAGDLVSITCKMHRKDRAHAITATEYLAECKRGTDPWRQWPRRMLRHKAMIQAARYAFSFAGIIDPDEAERFAGEFAQDVTPRAQIVPISQRIANQSATGGASTQTEPREQFSNTKVAETVTTEVDPSQVGQVGETPATESNSSQSTSPKPPETDTPASVPPADAGNKSQAKATEGRASMAVVDEGHVRQSTAGTGLQVGEASADLPTTSEIMDVTAGETAPSTLAPDWRDTYLTAMSRVQNKPKSLLNRHTEAIQLIGGKANDAEQSWMKAAFNLTKFRLESGGSVKIAAADVAAELNP